MAQRYLYPYRKRLEILSATFAGGFGVNLLYIYSLDPLAWAGLSRADALHFAGLVCGAAIVHALGVFINGRWRWSPLLRFAGMSAHAVLFLSLAWHGTGTTGGYTYGCVAALLAYGAKSACIDSVRAWKGDGAWKAI